MIQQSNQRVVDKKLLYRGKFKNLVNGWRKEDKPHHQKHFLKENALTVFESVRKMITNWLESSENWKLIFKKWK